MTDRILFGPRNGISAPVMTGVLRSSHSAMEQAKRPHRLKFLTGFGSSEHKRDSMCRSWACQSRHTGTPSAQGPKVSDEPPHPGSSQLLAGLLSVLSRLFRPSDCRLEQAQRRTHSQATQPVGKAESGQTPTGWSQDSQRFRGLGVVTPFDLLHWFQSI
eukprot:3810759-Amphidinium_carterae.1